MIKPKHLLSIHQGAFPLLRGTSAEFVAALGTAFTARAVLPEPRRKLVS
jgi:hypothetical protein